MQSYEDQPAGANLAQCRVWLDWAVTQINASLANDGVACERLLTALDGVLSAAHGGSPAASSADDAMQRKMSEVVVAVQYHDRLMQQLVHVAESLRGLYEHLGDDADAESPASWQTLGEKQMRAFSMPEERELFSRIVGVSGGPEAAQHAGTGSAGAVDLFDDSADEPRP
jgi:hypothetical protein